MARIEGSIIIDRPVGSVFDFVADECNEPRYNHEMLSAVQVTDGPIGLGTRFSAVMHQGRRDVPMTIEFTTFERPHRLGSHSSIEGMSIDGDLTFEPVGDATRMSWVWHVRVSGAMKLLSPVVKWVGDRQERRIWTSLRDLLETAGSVSPAQAALDRQEA